MKHIKADEHRRRLEMYKRGMSDREIARQVGRSSSVIREWRKRHNLPAHNYNAGVAMETALTPEQCEKMRRFFRLLVAYHQLAKTNQRKLDVGVLLAELNTLAGGTPRGKRKYKEVGN